MCVVVHIRTFEDCNRFGLWNSRYVRSDRFWCTVHRTYFSAKFQLLIDMLAGCDLCYIETASFLTQNMLLIDLIFLNIHHNIALKNKPEQFSNAGIPAKYYAVPYPRKSLGGFPLCFSI